MTRLRLLPMICLLFVAGCHDAGGSCSSSEISRLVSPDGQRDAVLFERDCGATTGFSSQVSVVGRGEAVRGRGGNALVADTDHGAAPAGPWGGPVVEMTWTGDDQLILRYSAAARVVASPAAAGGVVVVHRPDPSDPASVNITH